MAPSLKPQLLEAASITRTTQNTGIIFTSLLLLFTALATVASGLEPVVSVAGVGTTAVAGLLLPGGVAAQSVDLLAALALHNTTRQGVSRTTGPQDLRPAYYLQGDYRDLRLPPNTFQRVVELLRTNPEFTFAAWLRQDETNSGSIVSFSHGNNRYLELQSSGRKDEIRLHYTSQHDATVHVETFPYRLADNAWHQLAVSVSGAQVELLVDCHPVYRRVLRLGAPDRNLTQAIPPLQLWVGQRNNRHSLFKGSLQDVRVIMGPHGYLAQCPHLNSTCPTCGQFSLLQSTVQELTRHLHELSERLVAAEGRIGRVEQCDCQKSCRLNGTAHGDGTTWKRDCDMCSCVHGEVECRPVQCPKITCKNPVINPGDCCPTCLKQCYLRGVLYDHGEQVALKQCVECECKDGSMQCKRINPDTMCPPLQCPPEKQFSVPGECCKFCPGVNYCAKGHICHDNATCLNLQTTYACHCDQGFHGDGHMCSDVDECKQEGGLEGHHCQSNTKCVNTPGSYVCECLTGYRRIDKFNCAELDECSTGEHGCDLHANCVNTQGSYHCVCQHGYTGDGYHCKPICNQTCLNGGECVSPNKCSCRKGYIGPSCELDLDECANGLHRCHPASVCVNMPGWYYCKCKHGYRSILRDNTLGTLCQDIDECKEGTHTCHPSARCINTDGGFRCTCTEDQAPDCKLSCMFEGSEVGHGQTVPPAGQPCRLCECNHGVITCQDPKCDCSVRGSETNKCCPQCDPNAVCTHQELRQVVFRSGERWIYQCQTCECLSGQVDCWDMDCPPLTCSDPVLTPGDCCPRCDNDPCSFDADDNSTSSGQPCTYAGRLYDSGTQWTDPDDRCTSCNCKVPFCAQLVSNVACCVHRTDVFAAVLISVVATLAARWGTMVWLLERAVYLPNSIRRPSRTQTAAAVPHQAQVQTVEWEWQWDVITLLQLHLHQHQHQQQRNQLSTRTQCLDTIARALLVSIIIVIRHCRTLIIIIIIIIQNNIIVQLHEWIVLPMIVQCCCLRKVTLRHRTRLRRKQQTLIAINEQNQTPITIKIIEIKTTTQHQRQTIGSRAVRPNRALVEQNTTNHTRLQHSTLETQVILSDACETFLMDICELHSN